MSNSTPWWVEESLGSKLLKTPTAQLAINGGSQHPDKRKAGGHGPTLADEVEHLLPSHDLTANEGEKAGQTTRTDGGQQYLTHAIHALLPTPAVNDMGAAYTPDEWDAWTDRMKAEHGNGNGHRKSLSIEAQRLLPTPTSSIDSGGLQDDGSKYGPTSGVTLTDAALREGRWGDYAPAIHRWEQILGRPAPAPTMTSAKGNPQLSPRFVEWMQGCDEGWVDDVPNLTRNEKLKALGNGVVWQQAAEAVRRLLAIGGAA